MRYIMIGVILSLCGHASAHQWIPTYPRLEPSYVEGILKVRMELFNTRKDVKYYEILVYDNEFNPVCSKSKLLKGTGTATLVSSRICSKIK